MVKGLIMEQARRRFLKKVLLFSSMAALGINNKTFGFKTPLCQRHDKALSTVVRSVNGRPDENMVKVIELLGGIKSLVGSHDVVVIKPNVQWWNQGAPNLLALKTFVDLVMERPGGFKGEVVMAENCHRGAKPWESSSSGWSVQFEWNSDLKNIRSMNELCTHLKKKYGERFSVAHWIDVDSGGRRVYSPADGIGYVYCDGTGGVPLISFNNGIKGDEQREVIMSYPIFKTDRGTVVDFKNGVWDKGEYTGQPMKFINFAALNHHSTYCGATSAIKNYLGISDLSGGADPRNGGRLTGNYYNFHSFPFNKWAPGPRPGMLGAEIAVFMKTIRKADMNITTAHWVGLASRVHPPMAQTQAVLASTDPVALDYHATKYLLYPNSGLPIHNPDYSAKPLHQYLKACAEHGGGVLDEANVEVRTFDFATRKGTNNEGLVVNGEIRWTGDLRTLLKYTALRLGLL